MLMWIVPQIVKNSPAAAAMLDKYVMVGVVHGHVQPGGVVTFDDITTLTANDADGKPLKLLQGDDIPPGVAGGIVGITGVMRQTIGQMGEAFTSSPSRGPACMPAKRASFPFPSPGKPTSTTPQSPAVPSPSFWSRSRTELPSDSVGNAAHFSWDRFRDCLRVASALAS